MKNIQKVPLFIFSTGILACFCYETKNNEHLSSWTVVFLPYLEELNLPADRKAGWWCFPSSVNCIKCLSSYIFSSYLFLLSEPDHQNEFGPSRRTKPSFFHIMFIKVNRLSFSCGYLVAKCYRFFCNPFQLHPYFYSWNGIMIIPGWWMSVKWFDRAGSYISSPLHGLDDL